MSPSASSAETYSHVSYNGIAELLAALEEQQARAASGASVPAPSPEFWEEYRAFQASFLVGDEDSSASSSSSTPAGSSGHAHRSPATPTSTPATAITTPNCAAPVTSLTPSPPSLNEDLTSAVPGAGAQCPPAVGVEQAPSGTPSSTGNAQALRELLTAIGRGGEQSPSAFHYEHGHPAYPQQPGAQFFDASEQPAYGPDPLLVQPPLDTGTIQGYFALSPPGYYMQNGLPPLNHYDLPVPEAFQHGYYYNYIPNGSRGPDLGGAPLQYAAPDLPMPPQSERHSVHLSSAKPLSATGRPNEPARLPDGETGTSSSKRKRHSPDWKGKEKAKEVEENSAALDDERVDNDNDNVGRPPKKRRRAPRKGAAKPTRTNRSYTLLLNGKYRCSRCGEDTIKNKSKHAQMCGKGPLYCPICGVMLKSRRYDSLDRHYKATRCQNAAAAIAASHAGPADIDSTAGTQLTFAYNGAAHGTHSEDGSDADEDANGYRDDANDEDDVYANVAGPSSITLEDIPTPKKKAKKGKGAKN